MSLEKAVSIGLGVTGLGARGVRGVHWPGPLGCGTWLDSGPA